MHENCTICLTPTSPISNSLLEASHTSKIQDAWSEAISSGNLPTGPEISAKKEETQLVGSNLEQALVPVAKQKALVTSKAYGKGKIISRKQGNPGQLAFPPPR